jgi:hypothetical protein
MGNERNMTYADQSRNLPLVTSPKNTYKLQELEDNILSPEITKQPASDPFNLTGKDSSKASDIEAAKATAEARAKALDADRKTALVTTSLKAVSDVMASNTQYEAIKGAADTNIYMLNHQKSLILAAGKQAAADRTMEGELNADSAALSLAAQGQDLNGAGVDKVTSSYRAMALQNAVREEAKMYAEMMGVDVQIANQDYNVEMADNANDMALYQGILNTGMSAGGYYAGKA